MSRGARELVKTGSTTMASAKRAKERRKSSLERQEREAAEKRKKIDVSGLPVRDMDFSDPKEGSSKEIEDHSRFLVNQTKNSRSKTTTISRFATLRQTRLDYAIEPRLRNLLICLDNCELLPDANTDDHLICLIW